MMLTYEAVKTKLERYKQEHLLTFYQELDAQGRQKLLEDIDSIDLELLKQLYANAGEIPESSELNLSPMPFVDSTCFDKGESEFLYNRGMECISSGKLAALTLAGGQGTRLGHQGPKGTYDIGLPSRKSLFEIQCCGLKYISEQCGRSVPWYIMTSDINDAETRAFFEENNYFGYRREDVTFFAQTMIPAVSAEGSLLLASKGKVLRSPNGNGGLFESMKSRGVLDHMRQRGVEWIFICGIDNCLVKMADPLFMGVLLDRGNGSRAAAKSFIKRTYDEKAGILCYSDGKPCVVEYTEIPEYHAKLKGEDGQWVYGDANVLNYIFSLDVIADFASGGMKYHTAVKKLEYIDTSSGNTVTTPNGYKFELFLFDAFLRLDKLTVMRIERREEFAPVKNKTGIDSAELAKVMMEDVKNLRPDLINQHVV